MPEDAETLSGLFGLRVGAPGWGEALIALALGLCAAALIGFALRALRQIRTARPAPLHAALAQAQTLPAAEKVAALARILQQATDNVAPGPTPWRERARTAFDLPAAVVATLGTDLYRPGDPPDPTGLEQAVQRALGRVAAR